MADPRCPHGYHPVLLRNGTLAGYVPDDSGSLADDVLIAACLPPDYTDAQMEKARRLLVLHGMGGTAEIVHAQGR